MNEQARTVFNIEEQKAKDVLAAIQVVHPVISIIREWGKVEQEYEKTVNYNIKLSEEIKSIKYVLGITCTADELKERLSEILEDKFSEYKTSMQKEEKLKIICDDMENEVILYQQYANMYTWIKKNNIKRILDIKSFEDKEEYLSLMFLLLNANLAYYDLRTLYYFNDREEYQINSLISCNGWNNMLKKLKSNEI